jgi:hypothetical protein
MWMRQRIERLARWPVVALLAVPTLGLFITFNFHPAMMPLLLRLGGGVPPPDVRLGYGTAEVRALLNTYGVEGRQHYRLFLAADLVFALCYGLFLAASLRLALRPLVPAAASRWNNLCLLPLAAAAADCVENGCMLALLGTYPDAPAALAYAASAATITKWLWAAAGIGAILSAGVLNVWRLARRRDR